MRSCKKCNELKIPLNANKCKVLCNSCLVINKKEYLKKWYKENKEKVKLQGVEYRKNNKDVRKRYEEKNKKRIDKYQKKYRKSYYKENKKSIIKKTAEYKKKRKEKDKLYAFKCKVRCLIRQSYSRKGKTKKSKTFDIIGLTALDLHIYLERTFFDMYGRKKTINDKCHIDHIIPLVTAKNHNDITKLCHYSNLRLVLAEDNLKKGSKLIERFEVVNVA